MSVKAPIKTCKIVNGTHGLNRDLEKWCLRICQLFLYYTEWEPHWHMTNYKPRLALQKSWSLKFCYNNHKLSSTWSSSNHISDCWLELDMKLTLVASVGATYIVQLISITSFHGIGRSCIWDISFVLIYWLVMGPMATIMITSFTSRVICKSCIVWR